MAMRRRCRPAHQQMEKMEHRIFLRVDVWDWLYGTIDKVRRRRGWSEAWLSTYLEIGGRSRSSGTKSCPRAAARTLYECGRIRDAGRVYLDCDIGDLWDGSRNGTYAMLAIRLLREDPWLDKARLWARVREAVRRETGDEPAVSNQGGTTLAFQLWHLGLIVNERR